MIVPIAEIRIGKRLRGLREATVTELVESIGRLGLQCPISVAPGVLKRPGNADGITYTLIAGAHRLEACKRLGLAEIECSTVLMNDDERLLWEIDENLCRAELTELERGEHLLKRKEVYERLHPETKRGANIGPQRQFVVTDAASFTADSAGKVGVDQRTIQRSIRRVDKIDPKVRDRIRDNPDIADSGVELDALATLDKEQQRRAVHMVTTGEVATVREAKAKIAPDRHQPAHRPTVHRSSLPPPLSKEQQLRTFREKQAGQSAAKPTTACPEEMMDFFDAQVVRLVDGHRDVLVHVPLDRLAKTVLAIMARLGVTIELLEEMAGEQ